MHCALRREGLSVLRNQSECYWQNSAVYILKKSFRNVDKITNFNNKTKSTVFITLTLHILQYEIFRFLWQVKEQPSSALGIKTKIFEDKPV